MDKRKKENKKKLKSEYILTYLDMRKINKINDELDELIYNFEKRKAYGCYFLHNKNKEIVYIGRSQNLCNRPLQSYYEKIWRNKFTSEYLSFYETETKSDMVIAEAYFINKYKPYLNKLGKYEDKITFNLGIKKPDKIYKIYLN